MTTTREAALEAALKVVAAILQAEKGRMGGKPCTGEWSIPALGIRSTVSAALDMADAALSTPATEPQGYVGDDPVAWLPTETVNWLLNYGGPACATKTAAHNKPIKTDGGVAVYLHPARPAPQPAAEHEYPDPLIAEDRYEDDQPAADKRVVPAWQLKQWSEQIDTLDPYAAMSIQAEICAIIGTATPAQSDKIAEAARDVLADHERAVQAAVAKAVEAERARIDGLERELRATIAERNRAQKDCELIAKRFTPKPIRFAPKDRMIIGVERPPQEEQTFFYDLIWCPDRKQFVTPFINAMTGASHYLDPLNMIGIVWPRECAAIRSRGVAG